MIDEIEIHKAVDFLRDNADEAARKKATRIYLEEYRKSLKADIMKRHIHSPVSAQEREAYASDEYKNHLEALKEAIYEDERTRFLRMAAQAKIEAWRTEQSNLRAMGAVG